MIKLVILDRDGVINWECAAKLTSAEQWEAIPGSLEAIAKLKKAGFTVVVATNQSIVAKGDITAEGLLLIHGKMQKLLANYDASIDHIFICPHQDSDNCLCRKPKPGMLIAAAQQYQVDFKQQPVPFVGDSDIDLLAANACGAIPILVKTGKGLQTIEKISNNTSLQDTMIFESLAVFADYWINKYV